MKEWRLAPHSTYVTEDGRRTTDPVGYWEALTRIYAREAAGHADEDARRRFARSHRDAKRRVAALRRTRPAFPRGAR